MFEFNRITSMDTLTHTWQKISSKKGCPGIDGVDLSFYRSDLRVNLRTLQTAITSGSYRPFTEKTYNHKNREICIHCVDDKIIQTVTAEIIMSAYTPSASAHGFIKNRSIYTAKKSLDSALANGTVEYSKVDIRRFYDSIDSSLLFHKLKTLTSDNNFLSLAKILIYAHSPGLSTGSCLSPALANLYLADFDVEIEKQSTFYSRYVDDMLVSPAANLNLIAENLDKIGLEVNMNKSKPVNSADGFRFLGFDIKSDIDTAIQNGNFALAEELYEAKDVDIAAETPTKQPEVPTIDKPQKDKYEMPNHIRNVVKKCHIIGGIVQKAKAEKYLGFPEKSHLLQVFHCLGEDGAKFIHYVLKFCEDYDYGETQRRINKYNAPNPVGCKKLCERLGSIDKCTCNFSQERIYPTPIIYARRVNPDCFTPSTPKDSIGHFKGKTPEHKAEDALSGLLELNKKAYEIQEQQKIFKGQIENLFERNNISEFQTPQGLLVKTDNGLFIKVG